MAVLVIGLALTAGGAAFTSASLDRREQDELEPWARQHRAHRNLRGRAGTGQGDLDAMGYLVPDGIGNPPR